jgi:predicted DNA-binding protein with PD1-like motif
MLPPSSISENPLHSHELTTGRTFAVNFDHGDDFFPALAAFCREQGVRHGYIPMFVAGFAEAEIVGACEKLADPEAPVWSKVHLTGVEAMGCGTLAYDPESDSVLPHIHTSLGEKARSAVGHTSHLLGARVQFLVEMLVVEVTAPMMTRPRNPDLYDVPLLTFGG